MRANGKPPRQPAGGRNGRLIERWRKALRTPLAPSLLSELAARGALEACWKALGGAASLRAFEEAADDLRARAATAAVELGCPLIESQLGWAGYDMDEIDEIRQRVNVFHYLDAKLLLLATALCQALDGRCGAGAHRANGRALMPLPAELPEELPQVELVPEGVDGVLGECFAQARARLGLGRVADDFRALGRWPRYLQLAWQDARRRDAEPRARAAVEELRLQADAAAEQLPVSASITEDDLRAAGADPDAVRETLRRFRTALPSLVLDLALFKVQLDGAEDARQSPFPVEWEYLASDDYLPGDLDGEVRLRAGDPSSLDDLEDEKEAG